MANFGATLQTFLGALVAGRCYPSVYTSSTIVSPYITFQKIHAADLVVVTDSDNREAARYQIDVWASTYGAATVLAASVRAAMKAASFACSRITDFEGYEEVSKEYRVTFEYYIWA